MNKGTGNMRTLDEHQLAVCIHRAIQDATRDCIERLDVRVADWNVVLAGTCQAYHLVASAIETAKRILGELGTAYAIVPQIIVVYAESELSGRQQPA